MGEQIVNYQCHLYTYTCTSMWLTKEYQYWVLGFRFITFEWVIKDFTGVILTSHVDTFQQIFQKDNGTAYSCQCHSGAP